MNKIDYSLGLLKRLACGTINGKPYVMLDDAEYIVKNGGIFEEDNKNNSIKDIIEKRTAEWPDYYDECNAQNYQEWFIKGTNVKLAFDYIDGDTGEHCYYSIVTSLYDSMDPWDSEEDLYARLEYILMNKDISWQYHD